mmetsp:Transcript_5367/g.11847  ORF Transcript_5367/g.11847 Transcript_5367/m.11847 type:complete len:331 (+) Transcript_5367:61-1053(+)
MVPALSAPSPELTSFVERFADGVCYGIEWALLDSGRLECKSYSNPQWRIEAIKKQGMMSLYTTKSMGYNFLPGVGLVGKAFENQQTLFVEDLQSLAPAEVMDAITLGDHTGFFRTDLAKEFGIHSAVFMPTASGVFEAGSTQKVACASDLIRSFDKPIGSCQASSPPAPPSAILQQIVEKSVGGCYGIEWTLSDGGRLECKSYYNPQWRIEAVQKKGLHGLYTTKSSMYTFMPGEGLVGKAFANQQMLFWKDMQAIDLDDVMDAMTLGTCTGFVRADLAEEFGIHSAVFMPTANGVFEVGSTQQVACARELLSEAAAILQGVISSQVWSC